MHEPKHDHAPTADARARASFAGPRLELPRFQFAPSCVTAAEPARLRTPHAPSAPALTQLASQATATVSAPQPALQPSPLVPQYTPHREQHPTAHPAANLYANVSSPARASWDPSRPTPAQAGILQRITPVHMGLMLVVVIMITVVTSGPASMRAQPSRLPALATGGGSGDVSQPGHAGATAAAAARKAAPQPKTLAGGATAGTPKARTRTPRTIAVGTGRLNPRARSGGIPSPAAAANLAIRGGGRVVAADTGSVRFAGIPSPAAAAKLGPEQLPFRPSDGVTLPRGFSDRDSHAVDSHYGADTLPMEAAVELPALTPGAAAERAELRDSRAAVSSGSSAAPVASGGLIIAY